MSETTDNNGSRRLLGAVSRRSLLAGMGAAAGAPLVAGGRAAGAAPKLTAAATTTPWKHAIGDPRGSDIAVAVGRSKEGRFGVMFKKLAAYGPPDELLGRLAVQMAEPADTADLDNHRTPAGFSFLGQFIVHDMTFDRTPMPLQQADPHALTNFDSPVFDLNSVYAGGPGSDPQLYQADGRLRVVRNANGVDDLPRAADGSAILGDPRNDESLILTQLHLLFLKFHNRCLTSGLASSLEEARRLTQWHFQWVIVNDYLPQVVGEDVVARFLTRNGNSPPKVKREYYKPANPNRPMMPIEYSVAAFRFGHSTIRASYILNKIDGSDTVAPVFGAEGSDLRGSRPLPAAFEIAWEYLFDLPGVVEPDRNPSRLIDAKVSLPLFHLPPSVVTDAMVSLAQRNLIRGKRLGLPSGQQVASAMGVIPLTNAQLGLPDPGNAGWGGMAPLWFYILREAELLAGGQLLGPVGGRLVAEVILGILDSQKDSYFNAAQAFQPASPIAPAAGRFGMGDFIAFAQDR